MMIVVGIDDSRGSHEAVRWVAHHGAALDASVTAVHVLSRVDLWELAALQIDTAPIVTKRREQLRVGWTEPLRAGGLRVTCRLLRGDPAVELLKLADHRDADLLVVEGKRHTALHDMVLGGTAHKVVNHSNRPVVLVPTPIPPSSRRSSSSDTRKVRPLL